MCDPRTEQLLFRSLIVVNAALHEHRDQFPYTYIFDAYDLMFDDRNIGLSIYEHDPHTPLDSFTIRWQDRIFELTSSGVDDADLSWNIPVSYLEEVVQHPQEYIDHPAKLDWECMKARIANGPHSHASRMHDTLIRS